MDFEYTESQKQIQKLAREFTLNEVAPDAEARDRTGEFPYGLYKKAAVAAGFTQIIFPEACGGAGGDYLSWGLVNEEIAYRDSSFAGTLMAAVSGARTLIRYGTEEQVKEWAIPVIQGKTLGSMALTEPNTGSDLANGVETRAVRHNGDWVINGSKAFITNVGTDISTFCVVLAMTGRRENGKKELSLILVPHGTKGFTIMPKYRKLGWRSSDTHEIVFEDCQVPEKNLVGKLGEGLHHTLSELAYAAINIGSNGIGLARGCLDACLPWAQERISFGQPISKFQHVQNMLVEMEISIETSTLLRNKLAWLCDIQGGDAPRKNCSITKYYCSEAAKRCADMAVQIFGGMGFIDDCPVSRYYRDCRILTIGDGTSEIHKYIIAKMMGC